MAVSTENNLKAVEILIYHVVDVDGPDKETRMPSLASVTTCKERKRIMLDVDSTNLEGLITKIKSNCGIVEEALKRGLGLNIDIKLARIAKS